MKGNKQQDRARADVTFIGKTCWRSSYGVLLEKECGITEEDQATACKEVHHQAHLHDVSASAIINT